MFLMVFLESSKIIRDFSVMALLLKPSLNESLFKLCEF
jgi:hypothetical protein